MISKPKLPNKVSVTKLLAYKLIEHNFVFTCLVPPKIQKIITWELEQYLSKMTSVQTFIVVLIYDLLDNVEYEKRFKSDATAIIRGTIDFLSEQLNEIGVNDRWFQNEAQRHQEYNKAINEFIGKHESWKNVKRTATKIVSKPTHVKPTQTTQESLESMQTPWKTKWAKEWKSIMQHYKWKLNESLQTAFVEPFVNELLNRHKPGWPRHSIQLNARILMYFVPR